MYIPGCFYCLISTKVSNILISVANALKGAPYSQDKKCVIAHLVIKYVYTTVRKIAK